MTKRSLIIFFFAGLGLSLSMALRKGPQMTYKPARKIPHPHSLHGDVREDDYFWMRERDMSEHVNARNESRRVPAEGVPARNLRITF